MENIPEFKYDYVFNKFKSDSDYITLNRCKLAFIYLFGKVVKRKEIYKHFQLEVYRLDEFSRLCSVVRSELGVTNASVIDEFYKSLTDGDIMIDINCFRSRVKKYFPNLPNNIIEECYGQLCQPNGKLKIYDLEKYLIV
jgi:hypothetical protein